MLTCSSERGTSLNVDWTLPMLPRVTTLRLLDQLITSEFDCKPKQVACVQLSLFQNQKDFVDKRVFFYFIQ
jgi:hypothetical protein